MNWENIDDYTWQTLGQVHQRGYRLPKTDADARADEQERENRINFDELEN